MNEEDKKYLAHRGDNGEEQTIQQHLSGTAHLAGKFAEAFGAQEMGFCEGMLHDIGKYSKEFQERLHGGKKVDHATAGAKVCWEKGGIYPFLSYCIAGHHAGLPDTGRRTDTAGEGTLFGRLKKTIPDYQAYKNEIPIPSISNLPFQPFPDEDMGFCSSVLIRMLYSCLVDADFLDTENFMKNGVTGRSSGESMDVLWRRLQEKIQPWLSNSELYTVNGRRTEILKSCMEKGALPKGLFRLTVPTGGGKTVASLAFALRHAVIHQMKRIIYVIPYTSIIEQNAKIFADYLGWENVLEHHSEVDYPNSEEGISMQLAAENWDKPVIVTTNVQFFESLFSNKSSRCRKLHNIADSIVIFDEAQMLPNEYLKPCVAVMEQLLRYYGTSMVLCTATQPALQNFFGKEREAVELCPRLEEQFAFFKRTNLENIGELTEEELVGRLKEETAALCIVNRRKTAQNIFQKMKGEGVFHLSTTMYPKHRNRVLRRIRERLHNGEKCVLISTSLVEAGVDLDFENVYRQEAGVDSIIQAAGRGNREGKRKLEDSKTYIFRLQGHPPVRGQEKQVAVTRELLQDQENLEELRTIQKYFEHLYTLRGDSLDQKNILGSFKNGYFPFARVSRDVWLIENQTKTIFINRETEAEELLEKIRQRGITRELSRAAGKYCVNVFDWDFRKLYDQGMLEEAAELLGEGMYVLREQDQYSEEMGLILEVEEGRALFG